MSTKAGQFIKSYKIMQKYVKQYQNLFLFSLQATQSNIEVVNYFCKKAPTQTFDWVLNMAPGNTVKKVAI